MSATKLDFYGRLACLHLSGSPEKMNGLFVARQRESSPFRLRDSMEFYKSQGIPSGSSPPQGQNLMTKRENFLAVRYDEEEEDDDGIVFEKPSNGEAGNSSDEDYVELDDSESEEEDDDEEEEEEGEEEGEVRIKATLRVGV